MGDNDNAFTRRVRQFGEFARDAFTFAADREQEEAEAARQKEAESRAQVMRSAWKSVQTSIVADLKSKLVRIRKAMTPGISEASLRQMTGYQQCLMDLIAEAEQTEDDRP